MMTAMKIVALLTGCALFASCSPTNPSTSASPTPVGLLEVTLETIQEGLRNPLKGIRAGSANGYQSRNTGTYYSSLFRQYIGWDQIETSASDGVQTIRDFSDQAWAGIEKDNGKVIPRVYLIWPTFGNGKENRYWPSDMTELDYSSPEFQQRLVRLIEKMGEAWDDDPRVAYIEMALIGYWGEQHSPTPTPEVQRILTDTFQRCFPHKLVMCRYPNTLMFKSTAANIGLHWDEWGSEMQWLEWDHMDAVLLPEFKDRWKTAVFGGENTNNGYEIGVGDSMGNFLTFGDDKPFSPDVSFTTHLKDMLDVARRIHGNHLGTRLGTITDPAVKFGMDRFQNTIGYFFEIGKARFTPNALAGGTLRVELDVTNTGASPFYYDWNVEVALLNPRTMKPVYREVFDGVSTKDWMPGEGWDRQSWSYAVLPSVHRIAQDFAVPAGLPEGEYVLAVTMLDPAGMTPAARFGTKVQLEGGYSPLGTFTVGRTAGKPIELETFDIFFSESSRYFRNLALALTPTVEEDGSVLIDLGEPRTVKSLEVLWNQATEYEAFVSADGRTFEPVQGRNITCRDSVTRNIVGAKGIRFLRIDPKGEGAHPFEALHVYGE